MQQLEGRIGLIGDVHAEDALLESALGHLRSLEIGVVLCAGDVVDGPGDAGRCCALLRDAGALVVRGNHDRWFLAGAMRDLAEATAADGISPASAAFLGALPGTRAFQTPRGPALLCHGMGENDMSVVRPDDYGYALEVNPELQSLLRGGSVKLVMNGHSHRPMVRHLGGLCIVNAGTLHRRHEPGFLVVDFGTGDVDQLRFAPDGAITRGQLGSLIPSPGGAGPSPTPGGTWWRRSGS